jgi:chromosome segregation ATPase
LRKETRGRRAAEKELSEATATVEELGQLKTELQATVDDVQADLKVGLKVADERAAEIEALEKNTVDLKGEIEGKTGELDSLRDELSLRNGILADLEVRFDQSQSACELAQQRIVALKSPRELEEIDKASDKLATDLEKETRAREAAENELAKATATVEDLSQLKLELQATVDDVQADLKSGLKVADERAAEIEALETNSSDLKGEIEGKTGELDSLRDELALRNEALADLEMRLEESQAQCESARLHIAALKTPEELEEIEKASDKLAADLRKEIRAREAAEDELAKVTATVEDLDQLKLELQATVSDLKADLKIADERAVEFDVLERNTVDLKGEIEGKTGELDSLRDELALRNEALADLESRLEESQQELASAQLRVTALTDPEDLEEVEKASDKLAADLRKEIRAREAAEDELAKSAATVEELSQVERELNAAIRDLNADLRLAGERAVDVYVLERNVTDLKDEVEKRTRELDSRNQAFTDLEKQLDASQRECELLRRRGPASNIDEDIVPEEAVTASDAGARVSSSLVVEKFKESIRNVRAYQTLQEYDPAFYVSLITTYKKLAARNLTDKQINDALRAEQAKLMERLLPRASDDAIIAYARLIVDQLDELQHDGIEPCLTLLIPESSPDIDTSPIYSESTKERELDTLDITLRSYDADRRLPAENDVWPDLGPIFDELFAAFGADNVAALENSYDPSIDRELVCGVSRALYSGILNYPKRNAANALRWLF